MENLIIIAIIAVILGCALLYIYRQKKRGAKCIGCPGGCSCTAKSCGSCSGCSHKSQII